MTLPPLASLRAFEAAARHLSFKRAAAELAVTPTAISHQIRLLEETLGQRLFERRPRQVRLTAAGHELFPVLRDGFAGFAEVIDRLKQTRSHQSLTVSVLPSFATKWLMPRLARFQAAFPDIHLNLHTTTAPVDLHAGMSDVAIRYGPGPYPGLVTQTLFTERFAPVCSPHLNVGEPVDLRRCVLLHAQWRIPDDKTPTWARWCKAANLRYVDTGAGLGFTDDTHAIQAAIAGQGVMLSGLALVTEELARGLLVQPFGPELDGHAYHLLHTGRGPNQKQVDAFAGWLASEITDSPDLIAPKASAY
jgi:LysR family glycine cleavage system transcriptional activator